MSQEERNTVVGILANLIVNGYVILKLMAMFGDGRLGGDDAIMIWARAMLWVIPIGIALAIGLTILFNIGFAIVTLDENPSFVVDERDRAIKTFGMKVALVVVSAAFIGAIIALAVGTAPLTALIGMYFGMSAGDLFGNIAKLVRYRGEA